MRITDTNLFERNPVSSQSHELPISFSSVAVLMVCVSLICVNFRARILNRTTWKDKQHQRHHQRQQCQSQEQQPHLQLYEERQESVNRPLPKPQTRRCNRASENSSTSLSDAIGSHMTTLPCNYCHGTKILKQNCTPTGMEVPECHANCSPHASNGYRFSKSTNSPMVLPTMPINSECVRPNRTFQLPKWIHKLIQYLTESRTLLKQQSDLSNGLSEIHKVPVVLSVHESTSGCSTGSVTDSQTSTDAYKKQETSNRRIGFFSPWNRYRSTSPSQCTVVHNQTHLSGANQKSMSIPVNYLKSPVTVQLGTYGTDTNSLLSDVDVIDPVYSKIRGSYTDDIIPCDYDSVLDPDEWETPGNLQRDSFISYSSENSDHASSHIYHQLLKRPQRRIASHVTQPKENQNRTDSLVNLPSMTSTTINSASTTGSTWSMRLPRQSPFRRVIGCVITSQSTESMTCLCPDTPPPQLPDRSYGQSTVNLVYRLRNLLRYKDTHQSSTPRNPPVGSKYNQKAATLTVVPYASSDNLIRTAVTQSCVNMTGTQHLAVNGHFCRSSGHVFDHITQRDSLPQLGTESIQLNSSNKYTTISSGTDHNGTQKVIGQSAELTQYQQCVHYFALHQKPPVSVQRSLNGSRNHLQWSDLNGSYGNIRHIDSEVDLLDASPARSMEPGCINAVYKSTSMNRRSSICIPREQISLELCPIRQTTSPTHEYRSSRPIVTNSPAKSLIGSPQTRILMSPLMERSMEDDEVQHALSHPSHLPCSF